MRLLALIASIVSAGALSAQTPLPAADAARTIIPAELTDYVRVLAHDSLRDRDTPSPGLERAARYVAEQFRRFGLTPAGRRREGATDWIQRYPIPGHLQMDRKRSTVHFAIVYSRNRDGAAESTSQNSAADFSTTAYYAMPVVSRYPALFDGEGRGTVLVAGRPVLESLRQLDLHGKAVVYVPPAGIDTAARRAVIELLYRASLGVVVLAAADSTAFTQELRSAEQHPPRIVEGELQNMVRPHGWVVHVWPGAVSRTLAATGIDVARLRADGAPIVQPVPGLQVSLRPQVEELAPDVPTAPNVVGVIEGRDSLLKGKHLLIMAHLDGGARAGEADSGAARISDNASGVAGLLALAKAFSQPGARPRRSLLFIATSGGVKPEFWGASYTQWGRELAGVVNLDLIGGTGDSVFVDGLREADGLMSADRIAAIHPELGLTAVDGGSAFTPRSDHYALSRRGLPMLHFHTGRHADGSAATRETFDADRTARIARLAFYVGQELGNAGKDSRLNADGRRRFLEGVDRWE